MGGKVWNLEFSLLQTDTEVTAMIQVCVWMSWQNHTQYGRHVSMCVMCETFSSLWTALMPTVGWTALLSPSSTTSQLETYWVSLSVTSVSLLSVLSWLHDMGDMLGKFLFLCFVLSFNLFLGKKKKKCSFSVNFNRISKWLQNLLLCWNCQPGDSYHTDTRTPFISLSKFAFLTSYVWDDFCGFM